MKLSIVTIYFDQNNFGQRLQNYALQEYLKKLGHDVSTIVRHVCRYDQNSPFRRFDDKYMNLRLVNSETDVKEQDSDLFVIGSDQVFSCRWSYNSRDFYTLPHIPSHKKICYSASDGENFYTDLSIGGRKEFFNKICTIGSLSFREYDTYKTFESKGLSQTVTYNIDPTFLLSKEDWIKIEKKPDNVQEDEVFDISYFIAGNLSGINVEQENKRLQNQDVKVYDLNSMGLAPDEFIWMYHHCRKVYAMSFHGVAFSLIFGKPCWIYDYTDFRISNLFKILKIEPSNDIIPNDDIIKNIEFERTRSNQYLTNAFSISKQKNQTKTIMYSSATNIQVLVQLLKKFNIRHGIINPGTTHGAFVASILNDPFFKCYSVIDERSASYMAVGMSRELNEPVFIACTGATASRNYIPGTTEAFYSHSKVLYITGDYGGEKEMNIPQQMDRSQIQKDIVKKSYVIDGDLQTCRRRVSEGINYMLKDEGGPVHFNLISNNWCKFTDKLMRVEPIQYYDNKTIELPLLSNLEKISVYIESATKLSKSEIELINEFCEKYNAICLQNSNNRQKGLKYAIQYSPLVKHGQQGCLDTDILIYYGIPYSEYDILGINKKKTWMVGMNDGKFIDPFNNLSKVFDMSLSDFLQKYVSIGQSNTTTRFEMVKKVYDEVYKNQYEKSLPFSNIWIAKKFSSILPENSNAYFSVLNTYRSWNYWECKANTFFRNQGGYGIDGVMSSVIGQSIVSDELHFCFIGDSAFFYDLNSLGVHYIKPNLRICIMNNGCCVEFGNPWHFCSQFKGNPWHSEMMMAKSHYGNKSRTLVKHYAEDLGFKYISASNKQEFELVYNEFIKDSDKPIVFECFIDDNDDAEALRIL